MKHLEALITAALSARLLLYPVIDMQSSATLCHESTPHLDALCAQFQMNSFKPLIIRESYEYQRCCCFGGRRACG